MHSAKIRNFDLYTLKAFLSENSSFLESSRLQKIQQPTRQEFILTLRNTGESKKLYININPKFYHLCFMSQENEAKRYLEIPKKPPMFCMLLRKYLEGAKISKICQPEMKEFWNFILKLIMNFQKKFTFV